jgi:hypothetical protein
VSAALPAGCAAPQRAPSVSQARKAPPPPKIAEGGGDVVDRLKSEPVVVLREMYDRATKLQQYQLMFYRQERQGLFQKLGEMEEIKASFRKQPFSVKFVWDSPEAAYLEAVYVEGQNANKLTVRERKGILGMPPQVRVLNPNDAVNFGASKNPITDFGLAQVASRTVTPLEDPNIGPLMTVTYEGLVDLDPMHLPAYHLKITRPPGTGNRYTLQDFYIDKATLLPAGTDLYLPNGNMDARYRYAGVNTKVKLTDADFTMTR